MCKLSLVLFLCPLALQPADFSRAPESELLAHYQRLRTIALDPERTALTENFSLKKDAATFLFKNGTLYFFQPVGEKVTGAVFLGDGDFQLKPPSEIEQRNLARFTDGKTELDEPFKELVMVFTDSTFDDFSRGLKFRPGQPPAKANDSLHDFQKAFRDDLKVVNVEARTLAGLCFPRHGQFLAAIRGQSHGKLLFSVDPQTGEEVQLIHYSPNEYFDIWSSFRAAGGVPSDQRAIADTLQVSIDATVEKGEKLAATATAEFTALETGPHVLYVHLAPTLRVSKVTLAGRELRFILEDKKKDADLWVILPEPLAKGAKYTWTIAYEGGEVIRGAGSGNFYVGARTSWYPSLDNPSEQFADRAMHRMKFHTPKEYTLVATGKLVGQRQEGKYTVSEWETEVPYTVVGFNYGKYKTKSMRDGDLEVTVYANPNLGDELRELQLLLENNPNIARELGITPSGFNTTGMIDRALAEAVNSVRVFSHYFGPIPYSKLSITQQPAGHFGQSWPTLVFMPYTALLDNTIRNQLKMSTGPMKQFLEEVGSHEVAHQWWGHLVSWKDYHDQWLSEGFAQFSAGLYAQQIEGEKKFKAFLDHERHAITDRAPQSNRRPNEAGPIWLGHRLESEKTRGAYRLIYSKGGYVLHMLRMMLYDYGRRDDSRFIAMMRDFVKSHANREASTEDFKAVCDRHFKEDMGWFFRQWVYGTDIPKVTVQYQLVESAEGPVMQVQIAQQGVPEDFKIRLPFLVRMGKSGLSGKFTAVGPMTRVQVPLKQKPDSVEFNPLDGLLCELEVKK